jgi:lipopolysaccharide/colanic/teichoic acid biosynthesis glycosyltransferase
MLEVVKDRLGALRQRVLPRVSGRSKGDRLEDFSRALEREIARAGRTDRCLSVVLFEVKHRRRHPIEAAKLALYVCRRARATDCVGWVDDHNLGVILPDTPVFGARKFAESVAAIVSARMARPTYVIHDYPCTSCNGDAEQCAACSARQRVGNGEVIKLRESFRDDDYGDGDGTGSGSGLDELHASTSGNGNGNGHAHGNGNGNGHPTATLIAPAPSVHGNGNGNGNGNGHTLKSQLERVFLEGVRSELLGEHPVSTAVATRSVEELMVRPLPWWKRGLDIIGGTIGLVLSVPLIFLAAIAIKRESRGPVFFRQRRAGLGGKPFMIYKLRTMVPDAEQRKGQLAALNEQDGPAFKLSNDPRTTKMGRFLRRTSLDELPQFWNVLRGEMTLVGPRPLPVPESNACKPWQRRRLIVTPGITCIWQIYGRSRVSFTEWIRMDLRYIRDRHFLEDVKLLLLTVPAVLMRRGAR